MNKFTGLICMLLGTSFFIASCDDFFHPVIEIFIKEENQDQNNKKHKIKVQGEKQQNINIQNE